MFLWTNKVIEFMINVRKIEVSVIYIPNTNEWKVNGEKKKKYGTENIIK